MRITRFLLPGFLLTLGVSPALGAEPTRPRVGQFGDYSTLVPSVRPAGAEEPALPAPPMPVGRPPAAVTSLEQMTVAGPPGQAGPDPVGTLTAAPGLAKGSYPSPYYTDGPGCCGPMGGDGRIGYEVYTYSGVNMVFGNGLPGKLNAGWTIGGGARTLFFTPEHTAAWTVDLGLSYTHNWGQGTRDPVNLFLRTQPQINQTTGVVTAQPDRLVFTAIRELHRSSFNFNFGRDVWLMGAGNTGGESGTNVRVGAWVGGRYGTSHVDLVPLNEVNGYSRRQNVFEGVVVGTHATCETPMGGWILFGGVRAEYGYDWTNLVPPIQGNLHNLNIQATLGVRY